MKIIKLLLFIYICFFNIASANNTNKNITLQLSWFDQFQFAGYYIAKEKGFYNEAGLNVTIKSFEFGLDIPQDVSDGKYDFAVGRETLILEKASNKDIVALYALFQASPLILLSTKESGIDNITDFKNKRIMTTIDDASEVSIKSMITSQKLDIKNLNFIDHTHNINDLIEKNTDIISAYSSKSPYHLQQKNIPYNVFAPKDYGFDMYSDLLYTSKKKIDNAPETVLQFKNASLKGWKYAYNNIEETVELILEKYNPQNLSKEELLFEAKELKKLSYYKNNNLGNIDITKLQRIYDLYNVMGLVKNQIDIKDFVYSDNSNNKLLLTSEELDFIKSNTIECVTNASWTPFNLIDGEGQLSGIAIDYWNLIIEKTGIDSKCTIIEDWPEVLNAIKENKADITLSTTKTPQREKYAIFTQPYASFPIAIATKNDFGYISDISALKNSKIAVGKNTSASKILSSKMPNLELIEVSDIDKALELVSTGRVDAAAEILPVLAYKMNYHGYSNLKISGTSNFNLEIMMMINDDKKILASIVNKAIKAIDAEEKQRINNKWISVKYEQGIQYTYLYEIIAFFTFIILLLLYRHTVVLQHKKELDRSNQELEKSKQELKESNARLSIAAKVSFDLLYEINLEEKRTIWYGDIDNFLGFEQGEISQDQKDWEKLIHPEDKNKIEQMHNLQLTHTKELHFEYRIKDKDGNYQDWEDQSMPILNENGKPKKWIGVCTNISESKKLTKQLLEQTKMASMGEMIANIAHQWRQPLSVISTGATGLKLQKEHNLLDDNKLFDTCDMINENAQYLSKTIDDFRDFIKEDSLETTIHLKSMIDEFLNLMRASIKSHNINFILDIEEELEISGYKNELIQCLINLFNNSKDALKDNCEENERFIFIRIHEFQKFVYIHFSDNAGGIEHSIMDKIFEPYFTTKHKSKGTGLGLSMAYNLITEGMDGTIEVNNKDFTYNSTQYRGAEFIIKLPMT